ncbi:DUF1214 domain-containing protein [Gordonia hankookensis]|uniref:DUF1254 domain-containing protein n=1 Tax=Gordonia hankookensis TaxID=589403 RepID=A0ABR7WFV1_9ACTN|nr:DUF1214 domain-containing protein [Gordonia hankookensis]MBD1320609.1 DUF1254 domain-containing protein [Gordonia hankookensis]
MWATQDSYTLTPLSAWIGDTTPLPVAQPAATSVPADVVDSLEFFRAMTVGMTQNPPSRRDEGLLALFARLGIGPGGDFDPDRLDDAVASGLRRAIETGKDLITRQAQQVDRVNGWEMPTTGVGTYGTDFLQRARVAKYGYAGNVAEETIYPNTLVDDAGEPLHGNNSYVLRFPAGHLPPVDAFWSVTLYRWPEAKLHDNPLARYSIGDRTPGLTYEDGALEIVISHKEPESRTSNWLPAPDGPFWLIMRLYLPSPAVRTGDYALPAVVKDSARTRT